MQVQGTVISFNPSMKAAKKDGGQYDAWELVYRNQKNEVDAITKPVQSLTYNPALKTALSALVAGEDFTALLEKNKAGYYDVKSVEKGIKETQDVALAPAADGNRSPARGGKVLGSTYETPEERAKKQVIITRQASVNAAIAFHNPALGPLVLLDILETAKEFEKHYNKDLNKAAKKYFDIAVTEE